MYKPKISIITASYNRANVIEQCIWSVVNQTYDNIEFIIIDGGSTDGTVDVLKKYDDKISYWVSEPDDGLYDALGKGIAHATGDYVEIIGTDDSLAGVDVIAQVAELLQDQPDVLSCNEWSVDARTGYQMLIDNHHVRDKSKYTGGMVGHAAMFVKKELLHKYPFDTKYRIVSDYKFFLQCYYDPEVRFKYADLLVVFFETGSDGASTDAEACRIEDEQVYAELGLPLHDPLPGETRSWYKKIVMSLTDMLGVTEAVRAWKKRLLWQKHHCNNAICRWCHRG